MHKILELVNMVVALVAGLAVVLMWMFEPIREPLVGLVTHYVFGIPFLLVAVVAVVGNILVVLRSRTRGLGHRTLTISTDGGTDTISVDAIESRLLDELTAAPDISNPRVELTVRGEGLPLLCAVSFKLERTEDVIGRTEELKRRVREAFLRIIPSGAGIEINASVVDLARGGVKKAEREFAGPVYSPPPTDSISESS